MLLQVSEIGVEVRDVDGASDSVGDCGGVENLSSGSSRFKSSKNSRKSR